MQGVSPHRNRPRLPQDGKRRNGSVSAEVHFLRRGKVADMKTVRSGLPDEGRLRMFQFSGEAAHKRFGWKGIRPQGHDPRLISGKRNAGKGVGNVKFHRQIPPEI